MTDAQARASASRTCSLRGAPGGAGDLGAAGVEDQRRGRAQHADGADQLEVVLGVDLDVPDAGDHRRDVGQGAPGGAAGRAEGGGELQQRGALPQLEVEAGAGGEVDEGGGGGGVGSSGAAGFETLAGARSSTDAETLARSSTGVGRRWVPRKRPSVAAR